MPKFNTSLYLYLISGLLLLIGVSIDSDVLIFIAKPIIIPSLLFYYFSLTRKKTNDLFIVSFILFFIGDMVYLINQNDYYYLGLFIYLLPYLIIIYFLYRDLILLLKDKSVKKIDLTLVFIFVIMIYLIYSLLNLLEYDSQKEFIYMLIFSFVLFLMTILITFMFLYSNYRKNIYLVFLVVCFILSDSSFILNKQFDLLVFKIIDPFAQTISYYFYMIYFFERTLRLIKKNLLN